MLLFVRKLNFEMTEIWIRIWNGWLYYLVVFFGFSFLGSFFIGQLWLIEHMCSFVICVNWPLSWPLSPSLLKKERSDSTQTDYYFGPVSVVYASRHGTVKLSFENSQIVFPHRAAARLIISYARYFKKSKKAIMNFLSFMKCTYTRLLWFGNSINHS